MNYKLLAENHSHLHEKDSIEISCDYCQKKFLRSMNKIRINVKRGTPYAACSKTCQNHLQQTLHIENELKKLEFVCTRCLETKSTTEFNKKPSGKIRSFKCKDCISYCQKQNSIKRSKQPSCRFKDYRIGARSRSYNFNLTFEEFMVFWQKPCYYCGDSIETVGIDRVDNSIGYTNDNCVPCCKNCNKMKGIMNFSDFITLINKISKLHKILN